MGVERLFIKLSDGTEEIGWNPRAVCPRNTEHASLLLAPTPSDVHAPRLGREPSIYWLVANHCRVAPIVKRQTRQIGSDPETHRFAIPSGAIALSRLSAVAAFSKFHVGCT